MAKHVRTNAKPTKRRPALSPEERESQLISEAIDLAEQQILEGTASPSVITHFLKLASSREKLEQEMLTKKTELVSAQIESYESQRRIEELYSEAISAMRLYNGQVDDSYEDIF